MNWLIDGYISQRMQERFNFHFHLLSNSAKGHGCMFFNLDEVYDPIAQRVFVFQFFLKRASKSFNGAESNARKLIVVNNAQLSVCCDLYKEV